MSAISDRLASVQERIAAACARAGRDPASVTLVAVSKTHPPEAVREAWTAGQRLFGENYVQELVEKASTLSDLEGLHWHFIGHLQRNKAKDVAAAAACVETVGSLRLADAIGKAARARTVAVLIQVNVAREPQKSGCTPDELPALVAHVRSLPSLDLRGLMTIPPLGEEPEASRAHFASLRSLAATHGLRELSMGMSADLEVAIEEGATLVRVGTAIFGAR